MEAVLALAVVVLLAVVAWLFQARSRAERDLAVAREQLAQAERRSTDYERLKQEMLDATKAAVLEPAQSLSSKLLDDYKRENAEAKKESEARLKELAQPLVDHATKLNEAVAALHGQIQDKGRTLDTVMRALSSPGGAGQIAEVGLANTLKSFGLEEGRDYVLQFQAPGEASGQRLRPDAVVFLPGDTVLVIDCKASKAVLEIAEAEGEAAEAAAYARLAATMNQHLRALASKDYQSAVLAAFRDAGRAGAVDRMLSVMYLPSEITLDKLCRADRDFRRKAQDLAIIPAGPGTLHAIVSFAAGDIRRQRQAENQARIVETAGVLLDRVRVALEAAVKVGKGIEAAASSFADFANSVNRRLLPQAGKLGKFGVQTPKALPASVPAYEVRRLEDAIDGEAEEIEAPPRPRLIGE
ncbi:MAG: DNA recombination protein RmuC [Alphaproteobacteria bacterium]|nr:DNA recombination protein RmuC [Alphaproteobacteria bacterium]